ncbi:HAD family hydrolase [Moritella sp. Urea-trap-13]|uniref:HAD family hydrolase n=1 Tax=Moritella sp. Urea-trap-13 TaxID=2058327 RepID=UPI000C348F1E|nr:HAD family hydrolase [Moritella sp. Urea-trap-13]PKH06890.1 hydrolase [Moritella sp. Urea-trap-13]
MAKIYLFDWGGTLMVNTPEMKGKMCNWEHVEAITGAHDMLALLSQQGCKIYVATGAADSSEEDIKAAFERVGLAEYILAFFCKSNLGIGKGSAGYYQAVVQALGVDACDVTMVGDMLHRDIIPAIEAGLNAIWYTPEASPEEVSGDYQQILHLSELCLQ